MIGNHVINSSDVFILVYYTQSACYVPGVRLGVEYPTDSEKVKPALPIPTVKTARTAAETEWENSSSLE